MTIDADIESGLDAHVGLSAQIASRIYPSHFPEDPTFPLVVYNRISEVPSQAMGSGEPIVGYVTRFQFDGYAQTDGSAHGYNTARAIGPLLVDAIRTLPADTATINERSILDVMDIHEAETGLYRVKVEARFVHG